MAAEHPIQQLTFDGLSERPSPSGEGTGVRPGAKLRAWKPDLRQVKVSDLPESLRDISRLIGLPDTLALVQWRGGMRLTIPHKTIPAHPIHRVLGEHAARVLAAQYGGENINVPTLSRVVGPLRDRAIRADFDRGETIPALVRRYGLSERRIHEILNQAPE